MIVVIAVSIAAYMAFDFFDKKNVEDEREVLIRQKAMVFSHYSSMAMLAILAGVNYFGFNLQVAQVILIMVFASLYTEIAGKLYYRKVY